MNDDGFLATLQANPSDDETRLVYADWLEEHGDVRAEYLRLVGEVAERLRRGAEWNELRTRLRELVAVIPATRRELVGKRFDVVLESIASPRHKIAVIKRIHELTLLGLQQAVDMVELALKLVKGRLLLEEADEFKQELEFGAARPDIYPADLPRCRVVIREAATP